MSLDVYLKAPGAKRAASSGIFIRDSGSTREISRDEWNQRFAGREPVTVDVEDSDQVYGDNITHNLGAMASEADLYEYLWRPEEIGITHAKQLITPLRSGLARLKADPVRFKAHNPANGWGSYDGLVRFVEQYLAACEANPEATVRVWR